MSFGPAPLCWDDRDSSLFADLRVTLSTLQPKSHKHRSHKQAFSFRHMKMVKKVKFILQSIEICHKPAWEVVGWNREVIRVGLRLPAAPGFPMAKNVFQLPPADFRTFMPLFLLKELRNYVKQIYYLFHSNSFDRSKETHLSGRSSTAWNWPWKAWGDPCRRRGAWVRACASSRDRSLVDTNDLGLVRDCRAAGGNRTRERFRVIFDLKGKGQKRINWGRFWQRVLAGFAANGNKQTNIIQHCQKKHELVQSSPVRTALLQV